MDCGGAHRVPGKPLRLFGCQPPPDHTELQAGAASKEIASSGRPGNQSGGDEVSAAADRGRSSFFFCCFLFSCLCRVKQKSLNWVVKEATTERQGRHLSHTKPRARTHTPTPEPTRHARPPARQHGQRRPPTDPTRNSPTANNADPHTPTRPANPKLPKVLHPLI